MINFISNTICKREQREKAIKKWLDKYEIQNYTINDDLSINVNGGVDISNENLERIPVKFGNVVGGFNCSRNNLTSLTGSPEFVGGYFDCNSNQLVKLTGASKTINGQFWCENNPLTSLLEIVECNFKEKFYFNINKNNFKQKELIKILEKYYNKECRYYVITKFNFINTIKPQIQKIKLQNKLIESDIKSKTKINFI